MKTRLEISLVWGERPPSSGLWALGVHRGGPLSLLRWLETQLGLCAINESRLERVAAFRAALADNLRPSFAASFEVDPWATAAELLDRIDELRMAGWRGEQLEGAPPLVDDLAPVYGAALGGEADRLEAVLAVLDSGQRIPQHSCDLHEDPRMWPRRWHKVLEHLVIGPPQIVTPGGAAHSTLRRAQERQRVGVSSGPDGSLRVLRAGSATTAIEVVTAILAASPEALSTTVVCSARPELLQRLDGALRRRGLPCGGAAAVFNRESFLEVLPLVIRMIWTPIDPAQAMDLLGLFGGPVPPRLAKRLASALNEMPGIGSRAWVETMSDFEGDNTAVARTQQVFDGPSIGRGQAAPPNLLADRCRLVGEWARMRWATIADEGDERRGGYHAAACQAESLARTLDGLVDSLSEGQVARLLEMCADFVPHRRMVPQAGGPIFTSTPAGIEEGCTRLVWLGLGSSPSPRRRWVRDELTALANAGLDIDDGSRFVNAAAAADWRGLAHIEHSLLAIEVLGSEPEAPHPAWQEIVSNIDFEAPIFIEKQLEDGNEFDLVPWTLPLDKFTVPAPAQPSTQWTVESGLLHERDSISASEIEVRIGCPLAWVFRYNAGLRRGALGRLPSELLIKGNFLHQVMAEVFNEPVPPSPDEAAARAKALFNDRLPLDAAPLSMAAKARTRTELEGQIIRAARLLAEILERGAYSVTGMEFDQHDQLLGRCAVGAIDCLAHRSDGKEAIIDFKYGNRDKYPKMIKEESCLQLATYASMRRQITGDWPAIAYLMLNYGFMVTPMGGAVVGASEAEIMEARGAEAVWTEAASALRAGDGWLETGVVPIRPLQAPDDRSPHSGSFIDDPDNARERRSLRPCTFCDFKILCGVRRPV